MPIYEYECKECGWVFDELKRRDDETVCPECGGLAERLKSMPHSSFNYFTLKERREMEFK